MSSGGIAAADLELLRQYDTPTICNVIELFDVRPRRAGYMDRRIAACFPEMPPMVGYAATATFAAACGETMAQRGSGGWAATRPARPPLRPATARGQT